MVQSLADTFPSVRDRREHGFVVFELGRPGRRVFVHPATEERAASIDIHIALDKKALRYTTRSAVQELGKSLASPIWNNRHQAAVAVTFGLGEVFLTSSHLSRAEQDAVVLFESAR